MSTPSGTKSKLRETLRQEDAALAKRSGAPRTVAARAKAAVPAATAIATPAAAAAEPITPVLPPPRPAAARSAARAVVEKPAEKPAEAERKDKHEKVERDSFSMPASEHKRIKALREALGKDGVLASKSEVLRAGLALLAEQDIAEVARLVGALPKVAKGKRARKH